jgi:hypothetical protein
MLRGMSRYRIREWAWRYPLTSFLQRPKCYAVVQPRDTLSRSSADRFDTKRPICRETPTLLQSHFEIIFVTCYRPRGACRWDQSHAIPYVRWIGSRKEHGFFSPVSSTRRIQLFRWRALEVHYTLCVTCLPLCLPYSGVSNAARYITKENKFSVKAKCYGLRHKHPAERATPEARTYAPVCARERESP